VNSKKPLDGAAIFGDMADAWDRGLGSLRQVLESD
jgi:hypothetical protein